MKSNHDKEPMLMGQAMIEENYKKYIESRTNEKGYYYIIELKIYSLLILRKTVCASVQNKIEFV